MIAKLLVAFSCLLCCQGQETVPVKVVKGIPFVATATTESVQTLADGNRVVQKNSASIARDSEGRTRREQGTIVYLQDPVEGMAYMIDSHAQTVRRIPIRLSEAAPAPQEAVALGSKLASGFVAEGSRLKKTIAPSQLGNERGFEIISESWFSQQLQMIIEHRNIDPRRGTMEYRLTGIQLREPDAELFRVPKDKE